MPKRPKFQATYLPDRKLWVVNTPKSLSPDQKRTRQYFRDKAEAFKVARSLRERERTFGDTLNNLSAERMIDASKSFELLLAWILPTRRGCVET
jgi:hypothetical protein